MSSVASPPPRVRFRPRTKWLGPWGGLLLALAMAAAWAFVFGASRLDALIPHRRLDSFDPLTFVPPDNQVEIGSSLLAVAVGYTIAYRLRPRDGLSVSRLIIMGLVGGFVATLFAGPINGAISYATGGPSGGFSSVSTLTVGFVEEGVKILAVVILSRGLPVKNVRVGLAVGAFVGFGFSVFENVGYLDRAWVVGAEFRNPLQNLLNVTLERESAGLFMHPLWTALLAAAIFASARNGRFRLTWRVIVTYVGVAVLHSAFDYLPDELDRVAPAPLEALIGGWWWIPVSVLIAAIGVMAWLWLVRRDRRADAQDAALASAHRPVGPDLIGDTEGADPRP